MAAMVAPEVDVHLGAQSFAKAVALVVSLLGIHHRSPAKG
jgi:hypothetical protein